jgi:hypothetical protein
MRPSRGRASNRAGELSHSARINDTKLRGVGKQPSITEKQTKESRARRAVRDQSPRVAAAHHALARAHGQRHPLPHHTQPLHLRAHHAHSRPPARGAFGVATAPLLRPPSASLSAPQPSGSPYANRVCQRRIAEGTATGGRAASAAGPARARRSGARFGRRGGPRQRLAERRREGFRAVGSVGRVGRLVGRWGARRSGVWRIVLRRAKGVVSSRDVTMLV